MDNISIKTETATLLAIPVSKDAYRPTLITNPELRHRYEMFEWTERGNGGEHAVHIHCAEQWEELDFAWTMSERNALKIAETEKTFNGPGKFKCYTTGWKKSKHKGHTCMFATHSIISLFQSKGMDLKQNYYILLLKRSGNKGSIS